MFLIDKILRTRGNRILLNGSLFSLFSFINRGFIFLLLLILANFISPSEYGYLSLFSTVITILGYFICLSSEGYMSVAYFQEGRESIKYTFSTILSVGIVVTLFLLIIVFLGDDLLSKALNLPQRILYIAVLVSLFTALANVNLDYFRLKEQVVIYGIFSCGNAFLNFIGTILLIKFFLIGWEGRVYAQVCCAALFGLFSFFFFMKHKYVTIKIRDRIKPILFWSIPLIPMHAANYLRQGIDRYIINYSHSIEDVGLFSFALNIANVITMIGFGFNQSFSVDIYKLLGNDTIRNEEKKRMIRNMTNKILGLFILSSIFVTVLCYLLVPSLLPRYSESMGYFLVLSVYAFFVCYYLVYTNFLFFFKQTKVIMILSISSSLLHLILSLLLTQYSLFFTCIVYCISQSLFALGTHYYSLKVIKKQIV